VAGWAWPRPATFEDLPKVELRYDLTFAVALGTAAAMSRRRWRRTSETSEVRSMTGSWSGTWNVSRNGLPASPTVTTSRRLGAADACLATPAATVRPAVGP
jgi:hypothetical protein